MTAAAGFLTIAAALLIAVVMIVGANRRERAARRHVLDDCAGVLERATPSVAPSGYGVQRGSFHGRRASLTPIAEALAFRKLPQLWLAAALADDDPTRPSIEILRRPSGTEGFVGGAGLALSVRPPEGWPRDTSVRVSAGAAPMLGAIEALLGPALDDPKLKAVTVGPRGARVVRQAAQGGRGSYLLFREARFDLAAIPPEDAAAALDLAAAVLDRIRDHDRIETRYAA